MTDKTLFLSIIFILAISLSSWLMLRNNSNLTASQPSTENMTAFMRNVHYVNYNLDGQIHSKLSADQLTYYSKNSHAYFQNPKMQIYSKQSPSWFISAQFGKSKQGLQKVSLWNTVIIHPPTTNHKATTTIKTSKITIYPHQSRALTQRSVTIIRPGIIIQGKGLEANFKTGITKILADARSTVTPQPHYH